MKTNDKTALQRLYKRRLPGNKAAPILRAYPLVRVKTDKALRYRAQLSTAFVLWDGITATLNSCYSPIWGYLE